MTRAELAALCAVIRANKAKAARLDNLKTWLVQQRDAAVLQTTKALYQAIIDRIDEA